MRGVDHDPLRFAALARQFGENLVEHAQAAPSNKSIVDRLVRAIVARSVAPTQPVLDHKDDRADDPPIVHPRNPMRKWKIPFNPTHLNPRQQKQISHGEASQPPPMNQPIRTRARTLIGPEPSSACSIWIRVGSTFDTNLHLIASSISLARWRRGDLLAWRRSRSVARLGGPHGVGMEFPHVAGQLFGVG